VSPPPPLTYSFPLVLAKFCPTSHSSAWLQNLYHYRQHLHRHHRFISLKAVLQQYQCKVSFPPHSLLLLSIQTSIKLPRSSLFFALFRALSSLHIHRIDINSTIKQKAEVKVECPKDKEEAAEVIIIAPSLIQTFPSSSLHQKEQNHIV
jgi:hypothetical protein